MKQKAFFIIFKGFSVKRTTKIFLEGESPALKRENTNIITQHLGNAFSEQIRNRTNKTTIFATSVYWAQKQSPEVFHSESCF